MSLYQLTHDLRSFEADLEASGGEITPQMEELYAELLHSLVDHVEDWLKLIGNAKALEEGASALEKDLKKRKQGFSHRYQKLRQRLAEALYARGGDKVQTPLGTASVRTNKGKFVLTVDDASTLPSKFKVIEQRIYANRKAIQEAFDEGDPDAEGLGHYLEPTISLVVR